MTYGANTPGEIRGGFDIAKPWVLLHRPPQSPVMMRSPLYLALALAVASCAPKVEVVEVTPIPPQRPKPAAAAPATDVMPTGPEVVKESGMRVPRNMTERLPDRRDMTPTAEVKVPGGAVAIPPTAEKRDP